ncbi:MAG: hypothetical protein N3B12_02770 [Armatimonadetes bacterium]|nr:hypothetical protein [Armatimonadota bacterium]
MLPPGIYNRRNVGRIRYAQFAVTTITVLTCGYLVVRSLASLQGTWAAERMLREAKSEAARLSREVAIERRIEAGLPPPGNGGVDSLAVFIARWAAERGVSVESFVPEGTPATAEITIDESTLGVWNSSKVRVKGQGDYAGLMSLLEELRNPPLPVKLDSFAFRSIWDGGRALVSFDLVLTVYEKQAGVG